MPPPDSSYDAIVIGAGSGGLTVAVGLAGFGRRVALVEAGRIGGDCTNVGCIPSKRLIHLSRDPLLRSDSARILAAVRETRDGLAAREEREISALDGVHLLRGHARLEPGRRVVVSGPGPTRQITARHVVIATGSRPRPIVVPGLPPARTLTNETLFDLSRAPEHLAIVGAGPIGVEMACAFARMGSTVTLIDLAPRVLPDAESAASDALERGLLEQGIAVRLGTRISGYDPRRSRLHVQGRAGSEEIPGVSAVLMAAGRLPNSEGFERVVETDPGGIRVDGWGRTSAAGVWAVGDVTPEGHQTHAANALGRRVVQRIALPWVPPLGSRPVIPTAVFSAPEVAWVGPTAEDRSAHWHPSILANIRVDFASTDRGLTDGVRHGFISVSAVRLTGRVVAATVVGPNASDLLPLLTYAVAHRVSLLRLQRMVYAYPTFAGALGAVADEFARRTLPRLRSELAGYGRYRWARSPGRRARSTSLQ